MESNSQHQPSWITILMPYPLSHRDMCWTEYSNFVLCSISLFGAWLYKGLKIWDWQGMTDWHWCQFCTKIPEMSDLCCLGKTRIFHNKWIWQHFCRRWIRYPLERNTFRFFLFWFVKFVNIFEILVFFFNKYRCELCTCVNMEIDTHAKISKIPVLIHTCVTHL